MTSRKKKPQSHTGRKPPLQVNPPTPHPTLADARKTLSQAKTEQHVLEAARAVLQIEPADADALIATGKVQMTKQLPQEASENFSRALRLRPNDEELLALYINQAAKCGAIWDALCASRHWVAIAQKNVGQALRVLAGLYGTTGKEDASRAWAYEAARLQPMSSTRIARTEEKLTVLVLGTLASGSCRYSARNGNVILREGHNNLPGLLDTDHITCHRLNVDALQKNPRLLKSLPRVDIVYNGITDPERCRSALETASWLCDQFHLHKGIPIINHPRQVLACTRENNSARGEAWDGVIVPKSIYLGELEGSISDTIRDAAEANNLTLPLIMRAAGFQGAKNMHLIEDLNTLKVRLQAPTEVYLIEYTDTQGPDQLYWKYRAFLVGDTLYPGSVITSKGWISNRAAAKEDPELLRIMYEQQKIYTKDPRQIIGDEAWTKLERAITNTGLEYCGVDYGLSASGEPVIFETNPAMRSILNAEQAYPELVPAYETIASAVNQLFAARAGLTEAGIDYRKSHQEGNEA